MNQEPESLLRLVRRRLAACRGQWGAVAQVSGVPYHTITKLAQGAVSDPRVSTVQRLLDYFAQNPPTVQGPDRRARREQAGKGLREFAKEPA